MFRIGIGYDVHKLTEGRKLILGGVHIPFEKGCLGHSDADVLIHSIIDAILGALNKGDIGTLFPDTDLKYKDISSLVLLERTAEILFDENYEIQNIDSVLILQKPKIKSFIPQMKKKLANVLKINELKISLKATTTEGLGFEGKGEGVAAMSVVLISKVSSK